jgi:hypothetical protein
MVMGTCIRAQNYVPMPMQNSDWKIRTNYQFYNADSNPQNQYSFLETNIYPLNDTMIGGSRYIKFYSLVTNTVSYWGAVRQDTLGRKVFYIDPNSTNEQLLYDFNYSIGDTIRNVSAGYPSFKRVVQNIFYQSYNDGICRKTFQLKPFTIGQMTFFNYITEGIGNDVGIKTMFKSYYNGSNMPHDSEFDTYSSTLTINNLAITSVSPNNCPQDVGINEEFIAVDVNVFPNPAQDHIIIGYESKSGVAFRTTIFDIVGEEILVSESNRIPIDQLSSGCYVVKCIEKNSGRISTFKILKN